MDQLFHGHTENEVETIVFTVGEGTFGISVMNVSEIIHAVAVTPIPNSDPHIEGIIRLREEIITVANLSKMLGIPPSVVSEQDKFIICEWGQIKIALRVQDVSRIHRVTKEQIETPDDYSGLSEKNVLGVVRLNDQMVLLLDFEKIVKNMVKTVS
ncbi:purine-binding chemotaxis protein CheW [bacterium LRH843]|nr:purine-binding chemotaxis protein CheW [bacterium LRH843]